jgi:GNAT superfamily N-acetyltransferase
VADSRLRRAGIDVADALVDLRATMFAAMGTDPGGPESAWRPEAARWFRTALASPDRFAAFVLADPMDGRVVSGAAAVCEVHTPGPSNPQGAVAHLFNVCTLPGHEGRGYARACVAAVLDWVREETPAVSVDLAATAAGTGIYRSLGFLERDIPTMRLSIRR